MNLQTVNTYLNNKGYFIETTGDGSPTLRWGVGESMHHSGGAASESIYIYRTALNFLSSKKSQKVTNKKNLTEIELQESTLGARGKICIMSLGFGIGYNELLVADWILENGFDDDQVKLYSYEKETFLYENFNSWLDEDEGVLNKVFDSILESLLKSSSGVLSSRNKEIKNLLKRMRDKKIWIQEPALIPPFKSEEKFNLFLFDAFSNKTTPELWKNDFLDQLLQQNAAVPCVFSTYACRGELKRVLQKNNFQFLKRLGFKGKRDATLAYNI